MRLVPHLIAAGIGIGMLYADALTPEEIQKFSRDRPELDEITWKDPARGAPLAVRVIQANSQGVVVEKTLATGLTTRTLPLKDLVDVSFKFTQPEVLLHRKADPASVRWLRVLWQNRQATLSMKSSNAGETGLILAKSLRLSGETESLREATKILTQISSQDSSQTRIERAKAEELTVEFLIAKQAPDVLETERIAWAITEGPENPDGMLLATAFLGDRHFAELKVLEDEHPRWMDDDEIRPVRQRIYQLSLDFFLYPSLFHGTREAEAALGLRKAAEVYQATGSNAMQVATLEDLAALYPDSTAAQETAPLLSRLRQPENPGKIAQAETTDEAKSDQPATPNTPTSPPPPPKRYNIFSE